ncbi:hypothetical protein [Phytohabitans aurantiacus]|uniref:Lysoplasmalogenase n=1 Tax=Phytohabitans aurantiacus TaxID=3016789 RepID=A0ABQ5QPY7_9ACTN|nr:hypothetical protein [Phytohabitans aurantiacus]GLH96716.1 hypothetical protein Pa4123_19900 [Phytohabitans aurantiacus]
MTRWIPRRWPVLVAVVLAVLTVGGSVTASTVTAMGEVLPFLPLVYLVATKLRRRAASWPILIGGSVVLFGLKLIDAVSPAVFFVLVALLVFLWGAVGGDLRGSREFRIQSLGMLGFGALALVGLAVDPDLGRYIVGAGWLLHGGWDFVHLRRDKTVARSYAEWCGVLDVLVGLSLVLL